MLYFNFQLKSSEVGLTKAGLTVTLRKDWLRKNFNTNVSIQKSLEPLPLLSFERALIEIQAHDIKCCIIKIISLKSPGVFLYYCKIKV